MAHGGRVFPTGSRVRLGLASDEWLVGCVRRGDTAAFETLYDRHIRELLGFCLYMLGSRQDAEDAVQATFASAYRALRADSRPVALRPWLFTIARNDCLSILRRRRPVAELNGVLAAGPDPATAVELREEVGRIFEGLKELPESQRAALVLAEVHGLSQAEIGEVLGVRAEQVKAFVFQARSKLVSDRRARDSDCREIREELAGARGAALLQGRLRRHIRSCPDCRTYADGVARQRRQLGALLPLAPSLTLKGRALGELFGLGTSDPASVAGGATVGATFAGTAAEVAGGGFKALVCKLAAGMVCLGASAGVGVSVLEGPAPGEAGRSAGAERSPLLATAGGTGALAWNASSTPLARDLRAARGPVSGKGRAVVRRPGAATGDLPRVQNALDGEPGSTGGVQGGVQDPSTGHGQTSTGAVGREVHGTGGGGARAEAERRAAAEQHQLEHEARQRLVAERQKAREEHVPGGGSRPPRSEEEITHKREENQRRREEQSPEGHSRPPPTAEEVAAKKEKNQRRREEKRHEREEQAQGGVAPAP